MFNHNHEVLSNKCIYYKDERGYSEQYLYTHMWMLGSVLSKGEMKCILCKMLIFKTKCIVQLQMGSNVNNIV